MDRWARQHALERRECQLWAIRIQVEGAELVMMGRDFRLQSGSRCQERLSGLPGRLGQDLPPKNPGCDPALQAVGTLNMLARDNPFTSDRARSELSWSPSIVPDVGLTEAFRFWKSARSSSRSTEA
jgi:hypothetical protein